MENRTLCDGCGRITPTIHGRCPSCWHVKQATRPERAPAGRRQEGLATRLGDGLLELLWFVPGLALLLIALVAGDNGVLLVIALVLLLGGGIGRFGDVFLP
jgi:hypothetical protein